MQCIEFMWCVAISCLCIGNNLISAYPIFDTEEPQIYIAIHENLDSNQLPHHINKRTSASELDVVDLTIPFDVLEPMDEQMELAEINVFRPVFRYRVATAYEKQVRRNQQQFG